MKKVRCKRCAILRDEWCEMKKDSPDPELERDCEHYISTSFEFFPPLTGNEDDLIRRGDLLNANFLYYDPADGVKKSGPFVPEDWCLRVSTVYSVPAVIKADSVPRRKQNEKP